MEQRWIKNLMCAVVSVLALAGFAAAGDEPEKVQKLEDITVVAPPIIEGNEIDNYATEKTTVTEEQMKDLNAQDLSTALRKTPGVNITRYNPVGSFGGATGGAVFIRGFGSSRPGAEIKTLIDGVPAYMSVWNHPLLDLISIDPAASIEVYKSPQPHEFGNAFAVINLIPKRKMDEGFVTKADVAGGSYETHIGKAEHGGKDGRFDYYLGGGYRTSDGPRENADGELQDFYGRAGYQLADSWDLSFFGLYNDNYADDPGKIGADPSTLQGRYETQTGLTILTLENAFDKADGFLKIYRNTGEGNWLDQPTSTPGLREDLYNNFLFYGAKARETFRLWTGGEFLTGLDWDDTEGDYHANYSDGTTDNWDRHDFAILSPYTALSQQIQLGSGVTLTPSAGVRYYHHSDFDAEWSPHAGLILDYRETQFHAGYAHGVIYPGLDVVVMSEKVIPALKDTWKNLTAETVDHFEAGVSQKFGRLAVADITWFYDNGKDRYVIIPPPPPPPIYYNLEEYLIRGVEATLSLYPSDTLSLFAGVTFLKTQPDDLPYAPKTTFSAGLNWRASRAFKVSVDCQYVDKMYVDAQARRAGDANSAMVDSYFLLNSKVSYGFEAPVWGFRGEVYLAGENLTDTDYEYFPGYPMAGTNGMLGITVTF